MLVINIHVLALDDAFKIIIDFTCLYVISERMTIYFFTVAENSYSCNFVKTTECPQKVSVFDQQQKKSLSFNFHTFFCFE